VVVYGKCQNAADFRFFNNNQLNYALQTTCCTESGFLNDCKLDENYALNDEGLHISTWVTLDVTSMSGLIYNSPCKGTFNANISYWDTSKVTNMESMFREAKLFNQELHWDTSKVTNMGSMFWEANQFNKPLVWNTSQVTNMQEMFYGATAFNQDLNDWNVENVNNMQEMFYGAAAFRQNLCSQTWADKVTSLTTFDGSPGIISQVPCTSVVTLNQTLHDQVEWCYRLNSWDNSDPVCANVANWDVSQETNMSYLFHNKQHFNEFISGWDVGQVTNMQSMFEGADAFNQYLGLWAFGNANLEGMFKGISSSMDKVGFKWFDVGNVNNMQKMFYGATAFNQDLSAWNVGNVNNMQEMFRDATAFDNDMCSEVWNTIRDNTSVEKQDMFTNSATSVIPNWTLGQTNDECGVCGGDSTSCYDACGILNGIITDPNNCLNLTILDSYGDGMNGASVDEELTSTTKIVHTFNNGRSYTATVLSTSVFSFTSGDWDNEISFTISDSNHVLLRLPRYHVKVNKQWSYSVCGDNIQVFGPTVCNREVLNDYIGNCTSDNWSNYSYTPLGGGEIFVNCDIANWDVSQVTDMQQLFKDKSTFNEDISGWDVSQVTTMYEMFEGATAFNGDISGWDVSRVTNMNQMFRYAQKFNQPLDWDTSSVIDQQYMFSNAEKFNSVLNFRGSVAKSARLYFLYNALEYAQQSCLDGCDSSPYDPSNPSCYDSQYIMFSYTAHGTEGISGAQGTRDVCGVCGGDGSCAATVPGCTDSTAYNYNSDANVDDGSCACASGKVRYNGACVDAATFRNNKPDGTPTKKQVRKYWRDAIRPTRNQAKSKRANMVRLEVAKTDLSAKQEQLMDKLEKIKPNIKAIMTVATQQPESSTDIADCHYNIKNETSDEKEILMPYDEGHYAFICIDQTFVARQQETAEGTKIACWDHLWQNLHPSGFRHDRM
jgi:surface protein